MTETSAHGVLLHLIDTGCGMDDRQLNHIYETFYSTKSGGSGLGLPTTRKIIEAHGGRIYVQSEVGRGDASSRFSCPCRPDWPRTIAMRRWMSCSNSSLTSI